MAHRGRARLGGAAAILPDRPGVGVPVPPGPAVLRRTRVLIRRSTPHGCALAHPDRDGGLELAPVHGLDAGRKISARTAVLTQCEDHTERNEPAARTEHGGINRAA